MIGWGRHYCVPPRAALCHCTPLLTKLLLGARRTFWEGDRPPLAPPYLLACYQFIQYLCGEILQTSRINYNKSNVELFLFDLGLRGEYSHNGRAKCIYLIHLKTCVFLLSTCQNFIKIILIKKTKIFGICYSFSSIYFVILIL